MNAARIIARLCRGAATETTLARWCDVHVRAIRRLLTTMCAEGAIYRRGNRYAHPLSPAGTITHGCGYRWFQ